MNCITRSARPARRGGVLVYSMLVMTGLMTLSVAFYRIVGGNERQLRGALDDARAFYVAEAGLTEAMTALRSGGTGAVGRQDLPAFLGGGLFWVEATPDPTGGARTRLDVVAAAGTGRAGLSVVVQDLGRTPLFRAVLNSRDGLTLNSDVTIDSYDSEVGTYDEQAVNVSADGTPYANSGGHVGSNTDIVLNSGAEVYGNATPGPGGTVSFAAGAMVTGSVLPAEEPFDFEPIDVPAIPIAGSVTVNPNASMTLPPGEYGFTDITINKSGALTVQGPATVVVDSFSGLKDARLLVDGTGGPVTFFVREAYEHQNGFEAQPTLDKDGQPTPMALAFLIEAEQDIIFPSSAKVRGGYYAPNANITFTASNEAWGAFGGRTVGMSSGMRFHYDETLSRHWEIDDRGGDTLDVLYWEPTVEVFPAGLRTNRRDPFAILGVDPDECPEPSNAWDI